jgi:hypothetical protein
MELREGFRRREWRVSFCDPQGTASGLSLATPIERYTRKTLDLMKEKRRMIDLVERFAVVYLGPDWTDRFQGFEHALHDFLDASSVEERRAFGAQLRALVAEHGGDQTALEDALEERGWLFVAEDGNTSGFLSAIADVAERF